MAEELAVDGRREGRVGILVSRGPITDESAGKVADAGYELVDDGIKHIVINLEASPIANSVGIAVLIEIIEKLRELDGMVAFCCVTPILAKTFEIMGLLKVSEIYETEANAVEALG